MRAILHQIDPNDFKDWAEFAEHEPPDRKDAFGWFTLTVGPDDEDGTNYFQVLVSTRAALRRAKRDAPTFRGVVVDSFEAREIDRAIRDRLSAIQGTWDEIVHQLREFALWEYEGTRG